MVCDWNYYNCMQGFCQDFFGKWNIWLQNLPQECFNILLICNIFRGTVRAVIHINCFIKWYTMLPAPFSQLLLTCFGSLKFMWQRYHAAVAASLKGNKAERREKKTVAAWNDWTLCSHSIRTKVKMIGDSGDEKEPHSVCATEKGKRQEEGRKKNLS